MEALRAKGITKRFPGTTALDAVDFAVRVGEIHALLGENGAGKSTLVKIICGVYQPDAGQLYLHGKLMIFRSPAAAARAGIAVIHQELSLCPHLSIAENIYLGRLPKKKIGTVDWATTYAAAREELKRLGLDMDPRVPVGRLSVAQKQIVEIAKAVSRDASILLMDEPTSALTPSEIENLVRVMEELRNRGLSVVYISHKLEEVFRVADRLTVLRDGRNVGSRFVDETTMDEVTSMMIGRSVADYWGESTELQKEVGELQQREGAKETIALSVSNLSRKGVLKDVSFEVRAGEILGIYGLLGSGRTELLRAIFGADKSESGRLVIKGIEVKISSPRDALAAGIGLVPEERKVHGLFPDLPVRDNIIMATLRTLRRAGFLIDRKKEDRLVAGFINDLSIRTHSSTQRVKYLSGGNQQKVVISRWLATRPRILLLDEPTRGIDVGAKAEIHALIRRLAREGIAIVLVSSELPEIMRMADRVLIMREGRAVSILSRTEMDPARIAKMLVGTA